MRSHLRSAEAGPPVILARKVGPLPVWGWAGIVAATGAAWWWWMGRPKPESSEESGTPASSGPTSGGYSGGYSTGASTGAIGTQVSTTPATTAPETTPVSPLVDTLAALTPTALVPSVAAPGAPITGGVQLGASVPPSTGILAPVTPTEVAAPTPAPVVAPTLLGPAVSSPATAPTVTTPPVAPTPTAPLAPTGPAPTSAVTPNVLTSGTCATIGRTGFALIGPTQIKASIIRSCTSGSGLYPIYTGYSKSATGTYTPVGSPLGYGP